MENELVQIKVEREYSIPKDLQPLKETLGGEKKTCVIVYPSKKYVHYIEHIIKVIEEVMGVLNIEVKTLSEDVKPQGSNFQTILELLENCILGIVILDGLRPNVVLEYGMLLALKKSIIVLKDKNAEINIKGLSEDLKTTSNPKLDIDKHLSDVKDLHWTPYNWEEPDFLKRTLLDEITKISEDIIQQIVNSISPEIKNEELQKGISELAGYSIKSIKINDYKKINLIDKNIENIAKKNRVSLPATYYLELGNIYFRVFKYNKALESYNKAIELKPDYADAWFGKGVTLWELGRYEEELKAFDKSIELKPDDDSAWYNKGVALGKLGRYEEELKAYDKAIELKPDDDSAWYNKACYYSLRGDKENALKNLLKAIELDAKFKEEAKKDEDFKNLWDDEDFKKVIAVVTKVK